VVAVEAKLKLLDERLEKYSDSNPYGVEDDPEQKAIYSDIRNLAEQAPQVVASHIRNMPMGLAEPGNYRDDYVEALLKDPDKFSNLLLSELDFLIHQAGKLLHPQCVLSYVSVFGVGYTGKETDFERRVRNRVLEALDSDSPYVRGHCINLLLDFAYENEYCIRRMQKILTEDTDWRVRDVTFDILREMNKLPADYRRPFSQRLLALFFPSVKMKVWTDSRMSCF